MKLTRITTPKKFDVPKVILHGERRATVPFDGLRALWFNTGTLCNIACLGCYIESSPRNDRLAYLNRHEVRQYLREIACEGLPVTEIGFTGGEPFLNPDFLGMLDDCLAAGFRILVLTNAMKPMLRLKAGLLEVCGRAGGRLTFRVSLDHYTAAGHESRRGAGTWQPAIEGLSWLAASGVSLAVAGRRDGHEPEAALRRGFGALFAERGLPIDATDPARLVLFPEMDDAADVPEISENCWKILGVSPGDMMCASSRMVVKRKGADHPVVTACTLIPYDGRFEMGRTLADAAEPVRLNHVHCSKFCVLGGGSCSRP